MPGILFLLIIDLIMGQTTVDSNTWIRWHLTTKPEDHHYVDDTPLLSRSHEHLQCKTDKLIEYAEATGLNIAKQKIHDHILRLQQQKIKRWKKEPIETVGLASSALINSNSEQNGPIVN